MKSLQKFYWQTTRSVQLNFFRSYDGKNNIRAKVKATFLKIVKQAEGVVMSSNDSSKEPPKDNNNNANNACGKIKFTTDVASKVESSDKSKDCEKKSTQNICKKSSAKSISKGPCKTKTKSKQPTNKKKKPPKGKEKKKVTLIPGLGVGPEICDSVIQVLKVARAPIEWERFEKIVEKDKRGVTRLSKALRDSFMKNKVGLKGPLKSDSHPTGKLLRRELELFAYIMHCRNLGAYKTVYQPIDCVIIRDRTEGEYSGIEHEVVPCVLQTIKVGTAKASKRLAEFAFDYAKKHKRSKITVAHKANIMRLTDGIFLSCIRAAAEKHGQKLQFEERYLDTVCHNLIMQPELNDVLVASSMYGDVLSAVAACVAGGLTMCSAYNYGRHGVLYDCAHGTYQHLTGKDAANSTALLLSAIIMLRDLGFTDHADKVEDGVTQVYCELNHLTQDLGGKATLSELTKAICDAIRAQNKNGKTENGETENKETKNEETKNKDTKNEDNKNGNGNDCNE